MKQTKPVKTLSKTAKAGRAAKPLVFSVSISTPRPEPEATLPGKFKRLLSQFDLTKLSAGAWVPIKMHLGGGLGFTTIHPLLVRMVVTAVREAGGKPFVLDGYFNAVNEAAVRGYTSETLGCPIISAGGPYDSHVITVPAGYRSLDTIAIFGAIHDAPCLINLSHVKGHGACGYGGACKNIAMGCVDGPTRAKLHGLEGGIDWVRERCTFCGRCVKACDTDAIKLSTDKKKRQVSIFFHHCRFCRHCVAACPNEALVVNEKDGFQHFQEGMALTTQLVLDRFEPQRVLHINVLTNITMFCDCWGISTPSVVPDIGILASHDMVAVETASLDAIKAENFIPGSLVGRRPLGPGKHLFEQIHGKDPFVQLHALERRGVGRSDYELREIQ